MRWALAIMALAVGSHAGANNKKSIGGSWKVAFKETANDCGQFGVGLGSDTKVDLAPRGKELSVTIPLIPVLKGTVDKAGVFDVRKKLGSSGIEGLLAEYRMTGTADAAKGTMDVTLVARYYQDTTPYCQQSWTGTGTR
jgi:hypothetical protein